MQSRLCVSTVRWWEVGWRSSELADVNPGVRVGMIQCQQGNPKFDLFRQKHYGGQKIRNSKKEE